MLRCGLVLVLLWVAGAAAACPNLGSAAKHQFFSTRQLIDPKVTPVRAGGTVLLEFCETIPGNGNIPFDPSIGIYYTADKKRMDLELRTAGDCDTVLLIRSPSGRWFFDDDNGDGRNARLRIGGPREGRYEIWVGSNGGVACPSLLVLQSFRSVTRLAENDARRGRI